MAQELVLMAKEKYDTLTKSSHNAKNQNSVQTDSDDIPSVNTDRDSAENEVYGQLNMPAFGDIIQYTIPVKMQRKANGLLQYLQQHGGNIIKWNQRGQIIANGEVIQGSHIVDLLRNAVCPKTAKRPIGYERFYQALTAIDTPRSFISNVYYTDIQPSIKALPQKGDGFIVKKKTKGSPPGYSPPQKTSKTEIKWLKF